MSSDITRIVMNRNEVQGMVWFAESKRLEKNTDGMEKESQTLSELS